MKTPEQIKSQAEKARAWQSLKTNEREKIKTEHIKAQAAAVGVSSLDFEYVMNKGKSGWTLCGKLNLK
jgi:hypothetical protein